MESVTGPQQCHFQARLAAKTREERRRLLTENECNLLNGNQWRLCPLSNRQPRSRYCMLIKPSIEHPCASSVISASRPIVRPGRPSRPRATPGDVTWAVQHGAILSGIWMRVHCTADRLAFLDMISTSRRRRARRGGRLRVDRFPPRLITPYRACTEGRRPRPRRHAAD
jgi:hypothetical protein